MKIKIFIFLIIISLSISCIKQDYERYLIEEIKVFNSSKPLGISFANAEIGFIAGSFDFDKKTAVVGKTINGGTSWSVMPVFINNKSTTIIRSVFVLNKDSLYATYNTIDSKGICFSKNGGESWISLVDQDYGASYDKIVMFSPKEGFAFAGGSVYKTSDNWSSVSQTYDNPGLGGVGGLVFATLSVGFGYGCSVFDNSAVGSLIKTIDRGSTWQVVPNLQKCITALVFSDSNVGYSFTYNNEIYKTVDQGNNWSFLKSIYDFGESYYGVVSTNNGLLFSTGNSIYKTSFDFNKISKVFTTDDTNTALGMKAVKASENLYFFLTTNQTIIRVQIVN